MVHCHCSWNIFDDLFKCLQFVKSFLCSFVVSISLTRKFREEAHTPHCFSLKNHGQSFFLTHFSPVSHFYTPWKRQKTKAFLTFSGGIEMWHWTKMGWTIYFCNSIQNKSWILFLRTVPIWRNLWSLTLKRYLPKYIFRKNSFLCGNTKILVSYIDISVNGFSVFYFLNV